MNESLNNLTLLFAVFSSTRELVVVASKQPLGWNGKFKHNLYSLLYDALQDSCTINDILILNKSCFLFCNILNIK